jgi:uncharacterized protein
MQEHPHYAPAYLEGIRLFNEGHYWHAHEQWEHCWLAANGEEACFYQALIQAAAALVKWQQGNRRGLALNWAKSRSRLLTLPDHYGGLDLCALRTGLDQLCAGEPVEAPVLRICSVCP